MTAFENAQALARAGLPVFPSSRIFGPGAEQAATTDLTMIQCMHRVDPHAVWMVRCGAEFGLLALDTPRARDLDYLVADLGDLPRTLTVTRASGGVVRWFLCDHDADIQLGVGLRGTRGEFRRSAVVPGSVHPKSGEVYEVRGGAFGLRYVARLPQSWIEAVPKNTLGITANVVHRPEFTPQR